MAIASATFRGNVLFFYYSDASNLFGNINAIIIPTRTIRRPNDSDGSTWGSGSGINGNSTEMEEPTYKFTPQSIHGANIGTSLTSYFPDGGEGGESSGDKGSAGRVNLVSVATRVPFGYRYDLLMAISPPSPQSSGSAPSIPMLLRLLPIMPNKGSGQFGIEWMYERLNFDRTPELLPSGVSRYAISSGIAMADGSHSQESEGSAIYQLYTEVDDVATAKSSRYRLKKIDVASLDQSNGQPTKNILWEETLDTLDNTVNPRLLRFKTGSDNVAFYYDGVVIGQCRSPNTGTCLAFFNKESVATVSTTTPFESTACIAADNGIIVMVTPLSTYTYSFPTTNAVTGSSGSWNNRYTNGTKPDAINSPILTCVAKDYMFFSIQKSEDSKDPIISTLDFSFSSSWTWQRASLERSSFAEGENPRGQLAPGVLAAIVIAAVAALTGIAILWMRRTKSTSRLRNKLSGGAAAARSLVSPPTLTTVDSHRHMPGGGSTISPRSLSTLRPASAASGEGIFIPMQTMNNGGILGQQQSTSHTNSWSNYPSSSSSSTTGAAAAGAYNQRSSFPTTASGVPITASMPCQVVTMPSTQSSFIASSLVAAPYRPFVIPSSPLPCESEISTPLVHANRVITNNSGTDTVAEPDAIGNKQEYDHNNRNVYQNAPSSSASSSQRPNPLYESDAEEIVRAQRNTRQMQEMLSPTLANAQLILQQSQQPRQAHGQ
ncbi:hypothetical protein BX616_009192 [Lobosporangium transversale]|uniref:Uncharacterized protein n=1 Tax=Lobosporangium transversale TaxID=64571 RepID=A0A1Y2GA01_9FUNG|nr:hypothetical protein BCR41DRAFT_425643 [Lobosporangium transversale]KAF9913987.1 hypothetical protein BX616_009192 [Lobosporangium transversale]ORZ05184.1 hypothetical protein BCR41DRAFT_425643 [Lobosporangium transversale]|eukprot:XP_021876959.1 hypothetical protein BCR41DRAFT_425643 [Lobosporangium transversale]